MELEVRRCSSCGQDLPTTMFNTRGGRRAHLLMSWCKPCVLTRNRPRNKETNENRRRSRRNALDTARWILEDARAGDKKRGLDFDLDKQFISEMIANPCCYCGETKLRMTLDRVDNSRGHVQDNVVPACIRCNYVRRHMPYAAWLVVAEGMRKAAAAGLFGEWTGAARQTSKI